MFVRGSGWSVGNGRGLRRHAQTEAQTAEIPLVHAHARGARTDGSCEDGPAERPSVALHFRARSSRMSVALQDLRNAVSTRARAHFSAAGTCGSRSPRAQVCCRDAGELSITAHTRARELVSGLEEGGGPSPLTSLIGVQKPSRSVASSSSPSSRLPRAPGRNISRRTLVFSGMSSCCSSQNFSSAGAASACRAQVGPVRADGGGVSPLTNR